MLHHTWRARASDAIIVIIRFASFALVAVMAIFSVRPLARSLLYLLMFGSTDLQSFDSRREAIVRDKMLGYIVHFPPGQDKDIDALGSLVAESALRAATIDLVVESLSNGVAVASFVLLGLTLAFEAYKDRFHRRYACWSEKTGSGHTVAWRIDASGLQALIQPKEPVALPVWLPARSLEPERRPLGNPYIRAAARGGLWGAAAYATFSLAMLTVYPLVQLADLVDYRSEHDEMVARAGNAQYADVVRTRLLIAESAAHATSAVLPLALAFGAVLIALLGLIFAWRRRRPPFGEAMVGGLAVQVVGVRIDRGSWEARVISLSDPRYRKWFNAELLRGVSTMVPSRSLSATQAPAPFPSSHTEGEVRHGSPGP